MEYNQATIAQALAMIRETIKEPEMTITNPSMVRNYFTLELAELKNEVFCCLFLDNQHNVIAFEKLFFGTINASSVHPRVVVQRALELNAAAVILSHNHPSGICKPSQSDLSITKVLKDILKVVDVRILDHVIVGGSNTYSFAEHGEL